MFSTDLWTSGQGRRFFRVVLSAANLRWLHVFAAGLDDPVFAELARRGVRITGSAGSSAVAIAHTTVMQLLALCRNARPLAVAQSEHRWAPVDHLDLEGRTVLVVGLGSIGREVARLLVHFGVRVVGIRRSPDGSEPCPTFPVERLHDLLREADDVVIAASLDDSNRGLIGSAELSLLPPHGHVVNVGRGELIDEQALIDALDAGRLHGAALDVFATEPLDPENALWDMPNVIVTPHVAGRTPLSTQRAAAVFADNLGRWTRSEPLHNEFAP
ncbi:MAG: D-2-hydroxyacid dehydrogenase [Ilumatobacteraceae bacterium]